jgi:hypothetical protein
MIRLLQVHDYNSLICSSALIVLITRRKHLAGSCNQFFRSVSDEKGQGDLARSALWARASPFFRLRPRYEQRQYRALCRPLSGRSLEPAKITRLGDADRPGRLRQFLFQLSIVLTHMGLLESASIVLRNRLFKLMANCSCLTS